MYIVHIVHIINYEAIADKFNVTESVLNYELRHKSEISHMVCDFATNSYCIYCPLPLVDILVSLLQLRLTKFCTYLHRQR